MDALIVQLGPTFESGAMLLVLPVLWLFFFLSVMVRWAMHRKVRSQYRFLSEFERRVHRRFSDPQRQRTAFGPLVGQLFEAVLDEHYAKSGGKLVPSKARAASSALAHDMSREVSQWRHTMETPRFLDSARFVFGANSSVATIGRFSVGSMHRLLNAMPAAFLFLGSALTILGIISAGMPALGMVDATNVDQTGRALRGLIAHLPFTLLFAASGIVQAACLQTANTLLDPERVFTSATNKLAGALSILWQDTAPASAAEAAPLPIPDALHLADKVEDVTLPAPSAIPHVVPIAQLAPPPKVRRPKSNIKEMVRPEPPRKIDPEETTFVGEIPRMPAPPEPDAAADLGGLPPPPEDHSAVWGLPTAPTPSAPTIQEVTNHTMPAAPSTPGDNIPHPISVPHEPMTVVHDFSRGANVNDNPNVEAPRAALWGGADGAIHEDRLAVLKHRVLVIEQYLEKAAEDRMHGLISEDMWQEESVKWAAERDKLAREVAALEGRAA